MIAIGAAVAAPVNTPVQPAPATYPRTPSHSTTPTIAAAEKAWQVAETEHEPAAARTAWRAAADAFTRASAATTGAEHNEAAYAAVLAWKNAMQFDAALGSASVPPDKATPLNADEAAFVHAIGAYLPSAGADDALGMTFVRAALLYHHAQFDEALPDLIELVTHHPAADVAEYSANLLLDALNRQAKYDALADWVEKLRRSKKLVANRSDLVHTLDVLHVKSGRRRAEALEANGRSGDAHAFGECGQLYLELYRGSPSIEVADELLYAGGTCFQLGGDSKAAIDLFEQLVKRLPRSRLMPAARDAIKKLRASRP